MELKHYFDAVDFSGFSGHSHLNRKYTLGAAVEKNTLALTEANLSKVNVALLGLPLETTDDDCIRTDIPDKIRHELYQLSGLGKINVVDLGNLKQAQSHKGNYLALRDIVDYLTELKVTCLVLGGSQDFSYGICEAFRNNKLFTVSLVDAFLDIKKGVEGFQSDNYLSRIFSSNADIFGLNLIAYQRHYVPDQLLGKLKGVGHHFGLGQIRNKIASVEPAFRNSDFVSFDFGTLRYSEAFGKHHLPNGLFADEVCQLARYAGLSKRLKVCGLFEVSDRTGSAGINVKLAAQAAWYFLEAEGQQPHLSPGGEEGFIERKVEVWQVETPLVFCENSGNGQWWMRLQSYDNSFVYLACSEDDYVAASRNEIPEMWLKYVQKIDEILK